MSALFEPFTIGTRTAKNRVVRSGTYECRADASGGVTPELLKLYEILGQGNLGTVVTGLMHVSQEGKSAPPCRRHRPRRANPRPWEPGQRDQD